MQPYPYYKKSDPRFYLSRNKIPHSPLIVFVHFYGGHQKALKRHIHLVNELGYDAFAFNMPVKVPFTVLPQKNFRFGLKHVYTDMIFYFLNQIERDKIVFSFSNPSAAAIEALSDRWPRQQDVKALICDSGPSLAFIRSAWNLAIQVQKKPLLFLTFAALWSNRLHRDLTPQLQSFPKGFPILSIRGEKDTIIPPWHIEKVFSPHKHLQVQVASISEAGHLDALKHFREVYKLHLSSFLESLK